MESNKTCPLLEQYLGYLNVVKNRSENTIKEYRTDVLSFFKFVCEARGCPLSQHNFSFADIDFIKSITLSEIYAFLTHCQENLKLSAGTRARKIVSLRQFWKYLKLKAHLLETNITEEVETPKLPKRMPKYLTLEESVRLLTASKNSPRDHCILTILLNCALRISELHSLNLEQVSTDVITIIGKGNKERKIFLTPAAKNALMSWLQIRNTLNVTTNALFVSRNSGRMTTRSLQDVIKKYVSLSGLEAEGISAHKLRHTSATLMYKYGRVDIRSLQQILGHESVATTEIYTHVDESQLQAAVNSNPLAIMFS